MIDFSTPYLAMHKLMKDFHDAILKGNYKRAYEISIDITDVSQHLEDITKNLAKEYPDGF